MPDTAATAREMAEKYRALAEMTDATRRAAYLVMAEWWEQRARELEAAGKIAPAEKGKSDTE